MERVIHVSLPPLPPGYTARFAAYAIDDNGQARGDWIVFPTPGFAGWWCRVRYRCFFQWVEKVVPARFAPKPKIAVAADVVQVVPPPTPPSPPTVH